ncbi:MAG: hypothetical protein CL561_03210 [Alphaproteobacteria bacterium]|nr:hypothetical protein [Alphaproteobacteria bacterium]|tara:strand:+ start:6939 stop:7769 length:831 start_codon:yes stop_codon:yes gene_type:complete
MSYYLSNLNLNMLLVFDAVCRHRNMTAAAHDLGLTQPAVSRYIKELKDITGTDFFIRGANGYELTNEGHIFWRKATDILSNCEVFTRNAQDDFDPAKDVHVNLSRHNVKDAFELLYRREIAAYLGYDFDVPPDYLNVMDVKTLEYCPVCSVRSPFAKKRKITIDEFVKTPHLKVYTGSSPSVFDKVLEDLGLFQDTLIEVPDLASVLVMLKQTDMLFFALKDHAEAFCAQDPDLVMLDSVDFSLPSMQLNLYWNKTNDAYKPNMWLRSFIKQTLGA